MRIWSCLRALSVSAAGKRSAALFILVVLISPLVRAQDRWKIQYFYDKPEASLAISDMQCPSARRCIAAGTIVEKYGRQKGAVVLTTDGGEHWSVVNVREEPISLFFLNESLGWMVTEHGIWSTEEGGAAWTKSEFLKGIVRVYFLNPMHGYAIGFSKAIYETMDGGKKWTKLPAAAEPATDPKHTIYDCITFVGQHGIILGTVEKDPLEQDPLFQSARPQQNSTTVILETLNGGKTWHSSTKTNFGEITRVSLSKRGAIVLLVEYHDSYTLPSSVFEWPTGAEQLQTVFGERNRAVTDFALLPDGSAILAAIEPPGNSNQIPIPGKLKMLGSSDLKTWQEMDVDYKAVGQRAVLATVDAHHKWVATDTGMILKLEEGKTSERQRDRGTSLASAVLSTSSPQ